MLIWLASYPRSGSTYLRYVLDRIYGVETRTVYRDEPPAGDALPAPELLHGDEDLDPAPHFVKTHNLRDATAPHPAIYLVRDGRDALMSHARYEIEQGVIMKGGEFHDALELLIDGKLHNPFPGERPWNWGEHVRRWTSRRAPTAVVRFEDLVAGPLRTTMRAIESLGVRLPDTCRGIASFDELCDRSPRFFSRRPYPDWPENMLLRFRERHGDSAAAMHYNMEAAA